MQLLLHNGYTPILRSSKECCRDYFSSTGYHYRNGKMTNLVIFTLRDTNTLVTHRYIFATDTTPHLHKINVCVPPAFMRRARLRYVPRSTELDKCRVTMMPQFHSGSRLIHRYSIKYFLVSQRWAILKTLTSTQVLSSIEPPCLRSSLYTSSTGLEWPSRCCKLWNSSFCSDQRTLQALTTFEG